MPVWRCIITGFVFGQTNQNRIHLISDSSYSDAAVAAEEVRVNWVQPLRALLMTEFVFTNIQMRNLSDPLIAPYNLPTNMPGTGGSVQGAVLAQALVYKIATAVAGRRGRGRFFLGGTGNNTTVGGILSGGNYSYYNNQFDSIRTRFLQGTSAGPLVLGLVTGSDPSTFRSAVSITLSPFPGIQSRRRVGIGV